MTIFKSLKYSCPRICNVDDAKVIVIDRICTCSKLIFQPESNKHPTKTGNQTHRTKTGNQNKQSRSETTNHKNKRKETENM
ncbi:cysteine protease, putative [Medicago truncatula]|nr:cysteine protease, putative [Medicago truncatula]